MTTFLLMTAVVILLCIIANRFANRLGMPVLICFIGLGMFFGVDGPLGIPFDDYDVTEKICSIALAFVMFYGGFGTKWETANIAFICRCSIDCTFAYCILRYSASNRLV